jgi:hypothetical protein
VPIIESVSKAMMDGTALHHGCREKLCVAIFLFIRIESLDIV